MNEIAAADRLFEDLIRTHSQGSLYGKTGSLCSQINVSSREQRLSPNKCDADHSNKKFAILSSLNASVADRLGMFVDN